MQAVASATAPTRGGIRDETITGRRVPPAVYATACACYGVFIARASFALRGRRAFGLFDDAMISLTYARNLASGHGLVWNVHGPRVEGITNLGWTLVMAVPELVRVPDRYAALFVQLIGVMILLGCGAVAARIANLLVPTHRHVGTIAAALVLSCYPLVYWTLRGMEVGALTLLLLLLVASSMGAYGARSTTIAGFAAAMGVLVRLDFIVFVAACAAWLLTAHRDDARGLAARMVAPALVSIALQEAFRRLYYGAWLPNTYALKLGGVGLGTRVSRGVDVVTYTALASLAVAIVLAAWAWQALPRSRRELGLVLALAACTAAYTIYVGGDAWEWMRYADRYLTPAVVLLLIAAAAGIAAVATAPPTTAAIRTGTVVVMSMTAISTSSLAPGGRRLFDLDATAVDPTMVILGSALFVLVAVALQRRVRRFANTRHAALALTIAAAVAVSGPAFAYWVEANAAYAAFDASHARGGAFLRATTPADASIAVAAAGATIYFAHRDGVDVLGKMDPRIAHAPVHHGWFFWPGHMKWDYSITLRERPSLIIGPWIAQPADLREIADAGYAYWVVRQRARASFGLSNDDDGGVFVAPGADWLDPAIFQPAPFPQFRRTMPLLGT